jgi:hypothetical protein
MFTYVLCTHVHIRVVPSPWIYICIMAIIAITVIDGNDIRYVFFSLASTYITRKKVRETDVDNTSFAVQLRTAHARHTRREGLKANYSRLNGRQDS